MQSPQNLPPIFNGEKLVAYAILKSQKAIIGSVDCTATLKGNMLGAKVDHKIPFTLENATPAPSLPVIHHLAAKALITDWKTAQKEKKSIVDLSIESSVISSHTAFIAIDEESSEPVSGSMKVYDIQPPMMNFRSYGCAPGGGGVMALSASRGSSVQTKAKARKKGASPFGAFLSKGKRSAPAAMRSEAPMESLMCGASIPRARCASPPKPQLNSFGGGQKLSPKPTNTLENLISAQHLDGSWKLTSSFAQLIGKSLPDLEAACPIGREGVGGTVWATVLAVSLLRSRYSSQQDEWELIAMKAESWLKKQSLPPGTILDKIFQDAMKLLK